MGLVLDAAMRNIEAGGGGPFAAAVFEMDTGKLVSLGVNLVTSQGLSMLHAEMVAISLAQRKLGQYDLAEADPGGLELISSAEPCAMCLGAIPWSGVKRVVSGAADAAVRAIGFDEGNKAADWIAGLKRRGIEVWPRISESRADAVLQAFRDKGGRLY